MGNVMESVLDFIRSFTMENLRTDKRKLFVLILILLGMLTILGSIVANFVYLSSDEEDRIYIAVAEVFICKSF